MRACSKRCWTGGACRQPRMAPDHRPPDDWRPGAADRLLLQAILLLGADGRAAWQDWSARVKLDDVGPAAFRLLPELYPSLAALGVETPDRARLKGISRKTWYENQFRQAALAAFLQALSAAVMEPLLLQGA